MLATGYSSEVRSGTNVSANVTTTVNVAMLQPGSVSGKVTQSDGVTPITGAAVAVYAGPFQRGSASTNGTGDYSIANLHPGAFTVQAVDAGYRTKEQGATVSENANTVSNLSLDPAGTNPIQYAYDELGRLVQVTDTSGDSAIYRYDAVGNIIAIERPGSGAVSVSEFTPNAGIIGAIVTLYGTGFSTTPGQNTVTFNGTAATVTSSTSTQIVTAVPAGAATGAIGVTTPTGSVTTAVAFSVLASSGVPTVTGFAPAIAASGTALTVNGTNFETTATKDNVLLNVSPAAVGSATTTAIQATVPPSATTGLVKVATPNGMAASANYLWVAPPPYAVTDVDSTSLLPIDTDTVVSVTPSNKIALRAFEGTEAHRASMTITGANNNTSVLLYGSVGNVIASATTSLGVGFIDATVLRSTSTYSVVFDPQTTNATTATLHLYDVPADFSQTIALGGTVTVPIQKPGQNGSLTFSGTAGHRVAIQAQNGTIHNQLIGCDVNVTVLNPDRSSLSPVTCMETSGFVDATALPTTGTYTIAVDPVSFATGDLPLTLYDVAADYTAPIAFATPTEVTTTVAQNGLLTFTGTGRRVSVDQVGYNCFSSTTSILPAGGGSAIASTCGGTFLDATTTALTNGAPYILKVDPKDATTGTTTVTLYDVPNDLSGSLTINDPNSTAVALNTPGQNGFFTFSVPAQEPIVVHVTDNMIIGTVPCVTVSLMNGATTVTSNSGCGNFVLQSQTLAAGSYTVKIDPLSNAKGSLKVRVTSP